MEKEVLNQGKSQQNGAALGLLLMKEWSFIPIRFDKRPDARLLGGGWKKYQTCLPAFSEGAAWAEKAYGLAIITGALSGVIVLDVDEGGEEHIKGRHLPVTPVVRTPSGGWHYYFKHPGAGKKIRTTTNILPNVDMRGDGGYAVMPAAPGYEWIISPHDTKLEDAPAWLLDMTMETAAKPERVKKSPETPEIKAVTKVPAKVARMTTERLKRLLNDEKTARAFMDSVGLEDKKINQAFNCILPGHAEKTPSASIYRGENGAYIYNDFHGKDGENVYLLAEIWASLHYKTVVQYRTRSGEKGTHGGKAELMTWGIRMLIDLGQLAPYQIEYKPLPEDVPPSVRKVYEGFIYLLQCRWVYDPEKPAPFTRRFAAGWSGLGENMAGQAIKYLVDNKYLVVESTTNIGPRKTRLFNICPKD